MLHSEAKLRQVDALFDFDAFIFQRLPETLHLYIIQTPSPSVHADLNAEDGIVYNELRSAKLAPLIRIENLRFPIGIHCHF